METKVCFKCKKEKPLTEFRKDSQKKYGVTSNCKVCQKRGLTYTEKRNINFSENISKGYKICSKCGKRLLLNNFRLDKSKPFGYCSSCNDCYRHRLGIKKKIPAKISKCDFCGNDFKPKVNQLNNKSGKIFCGRVCEHKFKEDNIKSHYGGYRKYILERDGGRCVLCKNKNRLNVHHIKTRGSGGLDEYNNLITLCFYCHSTKAHGFKGHEYKQRFLDYTSQFIRPKFWDKIMVISKRDYEKVKNNNNKIAKSYFQKIKNSDKYIKYREKANKYNREYITRIKEKNKSI